MAKSERQPDKIKTIRDENPPESNTATAVEDPPTPFDGSEETPTEPEPGETAEPARRGRPPGRPTPKSVTFFQRIAGIAPEDWGARAKIRLYRLAPIIDRLRGSETKFITMYEEVINEQRIKHDWGSGRYRLYLNFKMPAAQEKEVDMVEIDILDMAYPPKVPPGEWVDDSRNKDWAWAKASFPPQPPAPATAPAGAATGLSEIVNVFGLAKEMRKDLREEMQPAPGNTTPPATAPTTPAPVDPWAAAEKILNMRSENPMVTLMQAQLTLANTAAENAREREFKSQEAARDREYKLQEKLLEASKAQQTAAAPKGLLEQLTEFAAVTDKLEPLKRLFGGGTQEAAGPIRSGRFAAWDFAREVIPQVMNSKILNALADKISAGPALSMNPAAAQTNGNGTAPVDDTMTFVQHVVTPAMLLFYKDEETGGDFAEWLYGGHPARVTELQAYGEQRIFELYKNYAPRADWTNVLSARGEPAFAQFVHEFCTWKPEPDEEQPQGTAAAAASAGNNRIIDLDIDDREETGS